MEATQIHDRSEFHAERRRMIGGSDAPAVVGLSPFKGAYQVWAEKVGKVEPDELEGEHLELGLVIEPYMAGKYARQTGLAVIGARDLPRGGLCMHKTWPWMGCHLDAEIHGDPRGVGVFQIKSTGFDDEEWQHGAPDHVVIQTQHEMECRGASWGVIGVLFGAPLLHTRFIELDKQKELIEVVMDAEANLWRMVETGEEPPARGIDLKALKRMYPNVLNTEEVDLPAEAEQWDADYARGAALEADGRRIKNDAKAELVRTIGAAGRGKLPSGGFWRRKLIEKDSYTVAPSAYVDLRKVKK